MLAESLTTAALAGRICVALVLFLAAAQKLMHWRLLEGVIRNYELLPGIVVKPTSLLLPPAELVLAGALLIGLEPRIASVCAMLLLLAFATGIAINISRGRVDIDCGCHQPFLHQPLSPALVTRNCLLAAALIPTLLPVQGQPVPAATQLLGCGGGALLFLFYVAANTVASVSISQRTHSIGQLPT